MIPSLLCLHLHFWARSEEKELPQLLFGWYLKPKEKQAIAFQENVLGSEPNDCM